MVSVLCVLTTHKIVENQQTVPNIDNSNKRSETFTYPSPSTSAVHPDIQPNSERTSNTSATVIFPSPFTSPVHAQEVNSQVPSSIVAVES